MLIPEISLGKLKKAWRWSSDDPCNFGALTAYSSKTIKATSFKFDIGLRVSMGIPGMMP